MAVGGLLVILRSYRINIYLNPNLFVGFFVKLRVDCVICKINILYKTIIIKLVCVSSEEDG